MKAELLRDKTLWEAQLHHDQTLESSTAPWLDVEDTECGRRKEDDADTSLLGEDCVSWSLTSATETAASNRKERLLLKVYDIVVDG